MQQHGWRSQASHHVNEASHQGFYDPIAMISWKGNIIGPENRSVVAWGQEWEQGVEHKEEEGPCGGNGSSHILNVVVIILLYAFVRADRTVCTWSGWAYCTYLPPNRPDWLVLYEHSYTHRPMHTLLVTWKGMKPCAGEPKSLIMALISQVNHLWPASKNDDF